MLLTKVDMRTVAINFMLTILRKPIGFEAFGNCFKRFKIRVIEENSLR